MINECLTATNSGMRAKEKIQYFFSFDQKGYSYQNEKELK